MIKPVDDPDLDDDDWAGTVKQLTRVVERQSNLVQTRIGLKVDRLQETIEDFSKKDAS